MEKIGLLGPIVDIFLIKNTTKQMSNEKLLMTLQSELQSALSFNLQDFILMLNLTCIVVTGTHDTEWL